MANEIPSCNQNKSRIITEQLDNTTVTLIPEYNDNNELIHANGFLILNEIKFECSLNRMTDNIHSYKIMVRCISPETGQILISDNKKAKRINKKELSDLSLRAIKEVRSYNYEIIALCKEIINKAKELYYENASQLKHELGKNMNPSTITFDVAKYLALPGFLNSKNNPADIKKIIDRIIDNAVGVQMYRCTGQKCDEILKESNCDTIFGRKVFHDFIEYCIQANICLGGNPITLRSTDGVLSNDAQNFRATMSKILDNDSISVLWEKLNQDCDYVSVALSLRLSGMSYLQILNLKWSDIKEIKTYNGTFYDDFVIVRIFRDDLKIAMHNFSRPLIPPTARIILSYESNLIQMLKKNKKYSRDDFQNEYVIPLNKKGKKYTVNDIKCWEKDTLMISGLRTLLEKAVNPNNLQPSTQILTNIYKYVLLNKCGISEDNDSFLYLTCQALNDTGFINYECHSNMEAQFRYYSIMQHFQLLNKYTKRVISELRDDCSTTTTILPKTNHHNASAIITVKMMNGNSLKFLTEHGINASIVVKDCNATDRIEELAIRFDTL